MQQISYRNYQKNAFILIEGEIKSDCFYIVKEGKINIQKKFPVYGEKHSEILVSGDFFGVVGAMSQLPHLESAIAAVPSQLLVVPRKAFPSLTQKNPALASKIVRFFSKKIRQFNDRELDFKIIAHGVDENFVTLLNIAAVYENELKRKRIAAYMYNSINYYKPDTEVASQALDRLSKMEERVKFNKKDGIFRQYSDSDIIFCENEPADEVYILKNGKVRISKLMNGADQQLYIMRAGDVFGEMALLENKTRSATAVAMEDSEVLVITRHNFEIMIQKEPHLIGKLISLLAERIWTTNKICINSHFPDIESKVLDMLMVNYERNKEEHTFSESFNFNLSFSDIIFMLGSKERVDKLESNFLNKYKYIKIEKNSLICTDMQQLSRQVGALRTKFLVSKY